MKRTAKRAMILFGLVIALCAAHPASAQKSSIRFFEGSWTEALEKAKAEHKLIFLDAYTSWCGPCKLMTKNVFSDKKVGKFYNQNFINVKLDVEKGEGVEVGGNYNIRSVPALLFINSKGEVVREYSGYQAPSCFLNMGHKVRALSSETYIVAP